MNVTAMEWQAKAREQLEVLLSDLASAWTEGEEKNRESSQEAARDQLAESLNQGLRRLRQAAGNSEAASLAVELAAVHSKRCAVFLFGEDGRAEAQALRALGDPPLSLSFNDAAAFRAAVETKDPVVAMGTPGEISQEIADRLDTEMTERVFLFPLAVRSGVKGILFATGQTQPAVLELIAGITALQMETLSAAPATKRDDLVSIAGAPAGQLPAPEQSNGPERRTWTELTPDEQALHLKAQRFARRCVAEFRLENPDAVRAGISKSNLYSELRQPIDRTREEFRRDFITASPTMVDYFHLELVRGLAQDQEKLLGPEYPGVLV